MIEYIRWIGAALILAAGGGFGFLNARHYRKEEAALEELIGLLRYISAELQCRMTALPQLLGEAARQGKGVIHTVFAALQRELEAQILPDVDSCMQRAIEQVRNVPQQANDRLLQLGRQLGCFDLDGQLSGIDGMVLMCQRDLEGLQKEREHKLRSNQVLGLSAGAALVILLI